MCDDFNGLSMYAGAEHPYPQSPRPSSFKDSLLRLTKHFRQSQKDLQQNKGLFCSYLKWNTVYLLFSKVKLGYL